MCPLKVSSMRKSVSTLTPNKRMPGVACFYVLFSVASFLAMLLVGVFAARKLLFLGPILLLLIWESVALWRELAKAYRTELYDTGIEVAGQTIPWNSIQEICIRPSAFGPKMLIKSNAGSSQLHLWVFEDIGAVRELIGAHLSNSAVVLDETGSKNVGRETTRHDG